MVKLCPSPQDILTPRFSECNPFGNRVTLDVISWGEVKLEYDEYLIQNDWCLIRRGERDTGKRMPVNDEGGDGSEVPESWGSARIDSHHQK